MTYYKVKPEFDNKRKQKPYKKGYLVYDGIWIGNELYTEKELQRMEKEGYRVDYSIFDKVQIKKTDVYWFFGARFSE